MITAIVIAACIAGGALFFYWLENTKCPECRSEMEWNDYDRMECTNCGLVGK